MTAVLAFGTPRAHAGRALREARFLERSTVPVSALCVVANGVREHLRGLLDVAADVTFGEAVRLSDLTRKQLLDRTQCFLTRGRLADVFVFVHDEDARRLLAIAFGERASDREFSALERAALARLVHELAMLFDPLCAERYAPPQRVEAEQAKRCTTYVDLRIGAPIEAILGIGLSREPPADEPRAPAISPDHLLGLACEVRAEFASGTISAERLARLAPGDIVRMDTKVGAEAVLKVGGLVIARGRGGIVVGEDALPDTAAFAVDTV